MNKLFLVMIRDVCSEDNPIINECVPFSTKENAQKHFDTVVKSYKDEIIEEYVVNEVGYDEKTTKRYVLLESDGNFSFYKQGYYNDDHIEVWLEEKEIDKEIN